MFLGTRRIRSAGQRSGSVEITLPVPLSALTGVTCEIRLRDGVQPEIVLSPQVAPLLAVADEVWRALTHSLGDERASPLPLDHVQLLVVAPPSWPAGAALTFADCALALEGPPTPERAEAVLRLTAGLAQAFASRRGADERTARRFALAMVSLFGEPPVSLGRDFAAERLAAALMAEPPGDGGRLPARPGDPLDPGAWMARAAWLSELEFQLLGVAPAAAAAPPGPADSAADWARGSRAVAASAAAEAPHLASPRRRP